jgi:tetratricopeptide (TPR) repeat protein
LTPERRLEALREQVEQKPGDAFARYSLAMALRSAGRDQEAAAEFQELVRGHPDYVATYLMYGNVLEALDRRPEAAQIYEQGIAVASRARSQHARDKLAEALQDLKGQGG